MNDSNQLPGSFNLRTTNMVRWFWQFLYRSDLDEARMTLHSIPSDENTRTGRIVANSVIVSLQPFCD
jgi:hypothetical protein